MGKKCVFAEKPSAARNMAKALGGMTGTYNGEEYIICHALGHLYEFADPAKQVSVDLQPKYKSWAIENMPWDFTDFNWIYEKKSKVQDILDEIKDTFDKCDEIIIATDDDPSGEGTLLADEVIINLGYDKNKKISRMFFPDEAPKSIQKAFVNRKYFNTLYDDPDYVKALYRSKWDYLSMQFTRIASKCGDGKAVLRQGRLKSAMLRLVGEQLEKVANYKKVPFYQYKFKDENDNVFASEKEPKFPTKDEVPKDKYTDSPVVVGEKVHKTTAPPKLIDLASLSARLSSKGFKAKEVLDTYQKMYEAQVVSYPRTEDKAITLEQFNELLPLCDKIAKVVGVDPALLVNKKPRTGFVKEGMAHGANRPGTNVPNDITDLAKYGKCAQDIYQILATSYLAMLCADYEYDSQEAHLEKYPDFKSRISIPTFMGWKVVYNNDEDADESENSKGFGTVGSPFIFEGFPPKPANPTMKWLMKQLEKADVGTGATRTSTYADVTNEKSKYPLMKDTKGKITMTEYGTMGYKLLPDTHIGSLDITKHVFDDMKEIAAGNKNPDECLAEVAKFVMDDIEIMKCNGEKMRKELGITMDGGSVERATGVWNGKEVSFKRVWSGHEFTDDEVEQLLSGEEITIECVSAKSGKPFKCKGKLANLEYNGKSYVGFDKTEFVNDGNGGGSADRASGTWNGKQVSFKKVWSGHEFTDKEVQDLLAGKEITIDCVSAKTGKAFKCKGKLANLEYNGAAYVGFERTGWA